VLNPASKGGMLATVILTPGVVLRRAGSTVAVIVVKAPALDLDIRCGGATMEMDRSLPDTLPGRPSRGSSSGVHRLQKVPQSADPQFRTHRGRRYADQDDRLVLLCIEGGIEQLSIGDTPLCDLTR
jgi:hypothetical protein